MENNKFSNSMSLIEAVETLSNIAEMDLDQEIGIAKTHHLIMQDESFKYRTVHWLHKKNSSQTIGLVKDIFKVVLNYLKNFYQNDYTLVTDSKTLEGIKTIMVLVGEAARKIDKYTHLFKEQHVQNITELREYKQLQDFYLRKISRTIDEGFLDRWILALSEKTWQNKKKVKLLGPIKLVTKHVFVDLESVKQDSEYELFFIQKEDGGRFFNSRILRNIKLICDFGDYFGHEKGPLIDRALWKDRQAKYSAEHILRSIYNELRGFYKDVSIQESELARSINQVVMALMLASNPSNLITNESAKSCYEYFKDFQLFLRQTLASATYQKLLAYFLAESKENPLLRIIHSICSALYKSNSSLQDLKAYINHILDEAHAHQSDEHLRIAKHSGLLWNQLASDYAAMQKLFRRHSGGPLNQLMRQIEEGARVFDPYLQENCPNMIYSLNPQGYNVLNLYLPCPTKQEFIHKAEVIPEFKGFLKGNEYDGNQHLLINLQDRTSWREHARSNALEELNNLECAENVTVVTLAKETDFYHQLAPYHEDHQTEQFITHLKEHLTTDLTGFFFPNKKEFFSSNWLDSLIKTVHFLFFSSKNVLSKDARLDFIGLVYFFLELKIIDALTPTSFSFTCKDGIDKGTMASIEMFCLLKLLNDEPFSEEDYWNLNALLYAPAIINRERIPLQEPFNRMIRLIKRVELAKNEQGNSFKTFLQKNLASSFRHKWFEDLDIHY
ncbi:Uncharacterized protein PHSC3_002031 [Chlamydiales bacterium STE3]|nr:Uncharacterized protein PHSC3_002031 [Chlamydiales bacterium STE3]